MFLLNILVTSKLSPLFQEMDSLLRHGEKILVSTHISFNIFFTLYIFTYLYYYNVA